MEKYYKALEIENGSTLEEIKRAYRRLSKKYHPDLHQGNELEELAAERFREVKEAYENIIKIFKTGNAKTNDNSKDNTTGKNFNLYGEVISFSEKLIKYNMFRSIVQKNIDRSSEFYAENYKLYSNLDNFLSRDENFVLNELLKIGDILIEQAIKLGYHPRGISRIIEENQEYILAKYYEIYNMLYNTWDEIMYEKDDRTRGRLHEKKVRSIYGQEKVISNLIEKASISTAANNSKKSIYRDIKIQTKLSASYHVSILNLIDVICYELGLPKCTDCITYGRTDDIFENFCKYKKEERKPLLKEALLSNPYDKKVYEELVSNFGDKNKEVEDISNFFGIDIQYYKTRVLRNISEKTKDEGQKTYIDIKEDVIFYADYIGSDCKEILGELDEKISVEILETIESFPEEQRLKKAKEAIRYYPPNKKAYKYVLKNYGDIDDSLKHIVEGKVCDLSSIKKELFEIYYKENVDVNKRNFKEDKEKVISYANYLSYECKDTIILLDKLILEEEYQNEFNFFRKYEIEFKDNKRVFISPLPFGLNKKIDSFEKKVKKHLSFDFEKQKVLYYQDDTLLGGGEDGFAITNEEVIVCNSFEEPKIVLFNDIKRIESSLRSGIVFHLATGGTVKCGSSKLTKVQIKKLIDILNVEKGFNDSSNKIIPINEEKDKKEPKIEIKNSEVRKLKKNTYMFLAVFLGFLGAHRFYEGKIKVGILYLLFSWTYIPFFISLYDAYKAYSISKKQKDSIFI